MAKMIFIQIQAYSGFWSGAVVMVSLHNMILSFFLYKARQTNMSNILKIIFNFGNAIRFMAVWGFYMTPKVATILQCTSLQYVMAIGNVLVRLSLVAFLLWRLKQIHQSRIDDWVSIILFTLRAGFGVAQLAFQRPVTAYLPYADVTICNPNEATSRAYIATGIALEFIVDIYVTVRLIQVLRKANQNAAQLSSNMGRKSKRTLFTAVMHWNFLRLFVSVLFHAAPMINQTFNDDTVAITTLSVINIIISYVITVDAEIVRVIEGKDKKKPSSAGSEKSMTPSPRTPRTPPHYNGHSPSDLPKYSPPSSSNENYNQIDDDKIVVVSMKRLSFFEWANVVVGKRLRRNDDEIDEDEEIEEIIDGPPKDSKEDCEKGRRSSNFSGTTSATDASTLDENPDIVIN